MTALEVLRPGPLALLQDVGRPGLAALGITASGAFDRAAFRAGAALVGNDPDGSDAAIEVTLGGLAVRAVDGSALVALTGAPLPATVAGLPAPYGQAFGLAPGDELVLGPPERGVRSYLSVRGGLLAEPEFGSRSRDLLAQLGPPPLRAGDLLPVGPEPAWQPGADGSLAPEFPAVLDVLPGPRRGRSRRGRTESAPGCSANRWLGRRPGSAPNCLVNRWFVAVSRCRRAGCPCCSARIIRPLAAIRWSA